jgi:hypothetical protein
MDPFATVVTSEFAIRSGEAETLVATFHPVG